MGDREKAKQKKSAQNGKNLMQVRYTPCGGRNKKKMRVRRKFPTSPPIAFLVIDPMALQSNLVILTNTTALLTQSGPYVAIGVTDGFETISP